MTIAKAIWVAETMRKVNPLDDADVITVAQKEEALQILIKIAKWEVT